MLQVVRKKLQRIQDPPSCGWHDFVAMSHHVAKVEVDIPCSDKRFACWYDIVHPVSYYPFWVFFFHSRL
jgi:hypothetical protein